MGELIVSGALCRGAAVLLKDEELAWDLKYGGQELL